MKTPFTLEQFLEVFKNYNTSVWPMQVLFYLLGFFVVFLALKKIRYGDKLISLILAFFWLWIGLVYNFVFFTTINKAAYAFGALFVIQGILFLISGLLRSSLSFGFKNDIYHLTGILFLVYGLIIYPVLGYFLGHSYPSSPTFGLPCPTVIFTFGILLLANKKIPIYLLIIPVLWSIIGFSAAVSFGILEDIGLLVAGIAGAALVIVKGYSATGSQIDTVNS